MPELDFLQWWELLSYIVTVVGLPLAIGVFIFEQRKERQNDDDETYQQLSNEYAEFLKLVLDHADLRLLSPTSSTLTDEQRERRLVLFSILISLFERAYLLVYEEYPNRQNRRLWQSWEDYMREWCRRAEFREALPQLLEGEDPDFQKLMHGLAAEEHARR